MTVGSHDPHIGLVVEGLGEVFALPVLLRKWLHEQNQWRDVLGKPVPSHGRDKALARGGIEGYVATAAGRPGCRGVLVLLDAEADPACQRGPELLARAEAVTHKKVVVCLAEPKFEAWIVASAETMQLPQLLFHNDRDATSLIREALGVKYVKPTWEPRLASRVDFARAMSRAPSLTRMLTKFDQLVALV